MPYRFAEIAFTDAVKAEQERAGSRKSYHARETSKDERGALIGDDEQAFIEGSDSFYMATVNADGWPYVQHRGGPKGFVRLVGPNLLGFADFTGNKQYVSVGNLSGDNRVSLFFMDYPNRARLKLFAKATMVGIEDQRLSSLLISADYRAKPERFMLLDVVAFDWNCPQHITKRYSMAEIEALAQSQTKRDG